MKKLHKIGISILSALAPACALGVTFSVLTTSKSEGGIQVTDLESKQAFEYLFIDNINENRNVVCKGPDAVTAKGPMVLNLVGYKEHVEFTSQEPGTYTKYFKWDNKNSYGWHDNAWKSIPYYSMPSSSISTIVQILSVSFSTSTWTFENGTYKFSVGESTLMVQFIKVGNECRINNIYMDTPDISGTWYFTYNNAILPSWPD